MPQTPIRVLVVDDEEDFASALVTRLSRRGFAARAAYSGAAALAELARGGTQVVILDLKMPGMDGIETLHRIRRRHPQVEVIVLTGHGTVASGIEGMQIGAADYLRKPVPIETLCTAIQAAAERSRGGPNSRSGEEAL
ncbi:MAG: response regulator [Acidobacteriota bacterium]|jgi:DNA-binding response OmpR family regulator